MMSNIEKTLDLASQKGVIRSKELVSREIPRVTLTRLVRAGKLRRIGRGLYTLPDADTSEHHSLVEAARRVPRGIVCLLSALRFHEMTTQQPFEVWMAIHRKARKPKVASPPLRLVRYSDDRMMPGVENHEIEGVTVRITSPAQTVADCFRYRNKIGLDVAVEALRDYRSLRKGTLDELWEIAGIVRISSVIQPYIKAIL